MQASIEISLYPLHDDFGDRVLHFLKILRSYPKIKVETNGMSTQLFGQYDDLMQILTKEMKQILEDQQAIFVMKIGEGILRYESR